MARKSTIEKLKTRISNLEKDRQRKVDEQIELILKTDPEILQINSQIDDLKKMVKASEELERKKEELEKQMLDLLDQREVAVLPAISHKNLAFLPIQNGKIQIDINLKRKE